MAYLSLKIPLHVVFVVLVAGASSAVSPLASAQFAIGRGPVAETYNALCASCHGVDGSGGGAGTSSLLDDDWALGGSDDEIFAAIKDGWPEGGMPAYGATLTDEEIRGLVIYVRELQYRNDRPAPTTNALDPADADGPRSSQHHDFTVTTLFRHEGLLWSVEVMPDGRFLTSDRQGALLLVEADGTAQTITGIPRVWAHGQGGLLDIGLHPDFAENGWVYLSYSERSGAALNAKGMTAIVRGRIREGAFVDQETIYAAPPALHNNRRHHFGTRLVFDQGYLFFAIGDRGVQDEAQDLSRPNGKIHRIHDDGAVPADNPFVDQAEALATIWTYGNRNPQGMALHPDTGVLYETEHGPRGGDELNRITRGANYGWPLVSHGMNYDGTPITSLTTAPGITDPVWQWTPVIAASGLAIGSGEAFPQWRGDLFAGGLAGEVVQRIRLGADDTVVEREDILRGEGRVRDVATGPDGRLYVVFNSGRSADDDSRIVVLTPTPTAD